MTESYSPTDFIVMSYDMYSLLFIGAVMEIETQAQEARSRTAEQFVVRMPDGMRSQIKELSTINRRSMNAEIVMLLEQGIKRSNQGAQQ